MHGYLPRGWDSHMKVTAMLVGNFELIKPLKETDLGVAQALLHP